MGSLARHVNSYTQLLLEGRPLEAIERFYADEVTVFENRELARAGKAQCLEHERAQLAAQPSPPVFKLLKHAIHDAAGHVFLEYVVRFHSSDGRAMRLEQVAVQTWDRERIVEERFYYEGAVDESDESDESEAVMTESAEPRRR